MGGLKRAAREARRASPLPQLLGALPGGSQVTQPGDPDFSLAQTPGSQLQFPAAAGQQRVLDVQSRAQNQLQTAIGAGIDITSSEFDELRQAAREGAIEQKPTLGEKLLGWIGAPFETVNLVIQGALAGPEANLSLGDYANALWGGIEDDEEFKERTGLRPESFSDTLTMFGWEPADEFGGEAVLRGMVDFTGSMIIDPLTYVTGGLAGLGRRAAVAAGRGVQAGVLSRLTGLIDEGRNLDEFGNVLKHVVAGGDDVTDYTAHLAATHGQTMSDFEQVLRTHADDLAAGNMDNPVVRDLNKYLGDLGPNGDNVWKNFQELAIMNRVGADIVRPLAQRNFNAINPLALKELPLWARGGVRIGLPSFSQKWAEVGVEIPHTRGLGRKLIGDPMRQLSDNLKAFPKYKKLAESLSSGRTSFDSYRPLLNGLREGTLEPWRFHIIAAEVDNINNQAFRQAVTGSLHHHSKVIDDVATSTGTNKEDMYRILLERMELSGDEGALLRQFQEASQEFPGIIPVPGGLHPAVESAIDDAAKFMRQTTDRLHTAMSSLDPKFKEKYIDGYVPHIVADDGKTILDSFVGRGSAVPYREWAAAAEKNEPGKGMLAWLMNTRGGSGRIETDLGSNRFTDRQLGRLQAQLLTDDGPIMLNQSFLTDLLHRRNAVRAVSPGGEVATDVLETRYMSVADINKMLEPVIRDNAARYSIHLPRNWDGKVFKENPLEIVGEYVGAMDDTIKQWSMIRAMKMAGLVTPHSVALDVQDTLQNMMANVNRIAKKVPGEKQTPGQVADLLTEIEENPGRFAFHSTTASKAESVTARELSSGGLYSDRATAETFVRREGETGPRRVLVFDTEELPPSVRGPLEAAGELGDVRGVPGLKPIGSYDPAKGLKSFTPNPRKASILEGKKNLIQGIPIKAVNPMKRGGLDPTDIAGTRQLYQAVEGMTPGAFREMRTVVSDGLEEAVGAGFGLTLVDGVPTARFHVDPSLAGEQADAMISRAIDQLDNAFMNGELKGRLNHETFVTLAQNAPNQETSDLLYKYFKTKMASLADGAKEYLGSNPGEFVEITVLADEFYAGINDFITEYSAFRAASTGELVGGGTRTQLLAGKESRFAADLKGLRTAARDLKDNGYDEAMKIMRNVEDWTGVSDLPGYIKPHNLGLAGAAVEGMQIQKDIGLWLKNVARNSATVYTPEGVAAAKLATNNLLRTWRALATLPRPAFHIRNAIGAGWMNSVVGVQAKTYARLGSNAGRWKKALREGLDDPFSVIDADLRDTWKTMVDNDVLGGFVSSELRAPLTGSEKAERLDWLKITDPEKFVLTRVGGRTMESIEDVARAALFLEYYDPKVAGSAITAKEMVRAIHFDYNDLTPWETKIKSWVPFFVWTRRNLPRQLEMMVERPGVIERYRHIMQAMNDNLGGNDENGMPTGDLFSAVAAGTDFYVNPGTPFWARVMIDPDLPTADLLNLPGPDVGQIGDFVNNLLGPHVSTLVNINEQREFNDVNAPQPLNLILKGLAAVGFFDETIDGDVRIPYWLRTVQETALPFTRDIVDPLSGGPTDPNRQQRQGISQDDNPMEASLKSLLASLGRGVGVKFNTPVDVRSKTARTQDELDKIIADLRAKGSLPGSGGSESDLAALLGG